MATINCPETIIICADEAAGESGECIIDNDEAPVTQQKKPITSPDAKKHAGDENKHDINVNVVSIPPGKLGITVNLLKAGGILIEEILPSCPFKDEVQIGDRIISVDGKELRVADDLRHGNDRVRKFGIIPKLAVDQSCAPVLRTSVGKKHGKYNVAPATCKRKRDELDSNIKTPEPKKVTQQNMKVKEKQEEQKEEFERWLENWHNYQKIDLAKHIQTLHGTDGWEYRCRQLLQYKEDHDGNCSVIPLDYKAPDDLTLGQWADEQRKLYQENELSPERIVYLESQGFDFDCSPTCLGVFTGDKQFDTKLQEFIEYRQAHNGDGDVPLVYPVRETLGQWVHRHRTLYEEGTLDAGHHAVLEEKGFLFEPGTNVTKTIIEKHWKHKYKELEQFKQDNGHLNVPTDYKASSLSTWLDKWIYALRKSFKRKELSLHRIRMLETLGLDLRAQKKPDGSAFEAKWNTMYDELVSYQVEHHNCLVPTDHKGNSGHLGLWVRRQRKRFKAGNMRDDRLERLQAIGFEFEIRKKKYKEADVNAFRNDSNDCNVACSAHAIAAGACMPPQRGTWIAQHKTGAAPEMQDSPLSYTPRLTQTLHPNGKTTDGFTSVGNADVWGQKPGFPQMGKSHGNMLPFFQCQQYMQNQMLLWMKLQMAPYASTQGVAAPMPIHWPDSDIKKRGSDTKKREPPHCTRCRQKEVEEGGNAKLSAVCPGRSGHGCCVFHNADMIPILCRLCVKFNGSNKDECKALEGKLRQCQYFEKDGTPKLSISASANAREMILDEHIIASRPVAPAVTGPNANPKPAMPNSHDETLGESAGEIIPKSFCGGKKGPVESGTSICDKGGRAIWYI